MNWFQNMRIPLPVDPDNDDAPAQTVGMGVVASKFMRLADDIAVMRSAAEYAVDEAFSKRSFNVAIPGGQVPTLLEADPVPPGHTWEVNRIIFMFPDSAAASDIRYFARVYANSNAPSNCIGIGLAPLNDLGNGVVTVEFDTPYVLHQNERLIAMAGAQIANSPCFMNVIFRAVAQGPMSFDQV